MAAQDWGLITAAPDQSEDWGFITDNPLVFIDWGFVVPRSMGSKPSKKRGEPYRVIWEPVEVFDDRAAAKSKRRKTDLLLLMT